MIIGRSIPKETKQGRERIHFDVEQLINESSDNEIVKAHSLLNVNIFLRHWSIDHLMILSINISQRVEWFLFDIFTVIIVEKNERGPCARQFSIMGYANFQDVMNGCHSIFFAVRHFSPVHKNCSLFSNELNIRVDFMSRIVLTLIDFGILADRQIFRFLSRFFFKCKFRSNDNVDVRATP